MSTTRVGKRPGARAGGCCQRLLRGGVGVHGFGGGWNSLRSLQGASNVEITQGRGGALTLPPGAPSPACARSSVCGALTQPVRSPLVPEARVRLRAPKGARTRGSAARDYRNGAWWRRRLPAEASASELRAQAGDGAPGGSVRAPPRPCVIPNLEAPCSDRREHHPPPKPWTPTAAAAVAAQSH